MFMGLTRSEEDIILVVSLIIITSCVNVPKLYTEVDYKYHYSIHRANITT